MSFLSYPPASEQALGPLGFLLPWVHIPAGPYLAPPWGNIRQTTKSLDCFSEASVILNCFQGAVFHLVSHLRPSICSPHDADRPLQPNFLKPLDTWGILAHVSSPLLRESTDMGKGAACWFSSGQKVAVGGYHELNLKSPKRCMLIFKAQFSWRRLNLKADLAMLRWGHTWIRGTIDPLNCVLVRRFYGHLVTMLYRIILGAILPPSSGCQQDHHSWVCWLLTVLHRIKGWRGHVVELSTEYPATLHNQCIQLCPNCMCPWGFQEEVRVYRYVRTREGLNNTQPCVSRHPWWMQTFQGDCFRITYSTAQNPSPCSVSNPRKPIGFCSQIWFIAGTLWEWGTLFLTLAYPKVKICTTQRHPEDIM